LFNSLALKKVEEANRKLVFKMQVQKIRNLFWEFLPGKFTVRAKIGEIEFLYVTDRRDAFLKQALIYKLSKLEKDSLKRWIEALRHGGIGIDVGAYTGIYSLAGAISGATLIKSFEPNLMLKQYLLRNIEVNEMKDKIEVISNAVGDVAQRITMFAPAGTFFPKGKLTGTGVTAKSLNRRQQPKYLVPLLNTTCTTLDGEVTTSQRAQIRAIKIDVEGMELEVLRGAKEILTQTRPLLIVEALENEAEIEIRNLLNTVGYTKYLRFGKNLVCS
jgi:FkbM family methyltransferase